MYNGYNAIQKSQMCAGCAQVYKLSLTALYLSSYVVKSHKIEALNLLYFK